jgi:type IV secretory pathway protease TraF
VSHACIEAALITKISRQCRNQTGLPSGKTEWHAAYLKHIQTVHSDRVVGWKTFKVIDGQLLSDSTEIRDRGRLPRSVHSYICGNSTLD